MINPEFLDMKPSELAQLYVLVTKYPVLIRTSPAKIMDALVTLVGYEDAMAAIRDAANEHK